MLVESADRVVSSARSADDEPHSTLSNMEAEQLLEHWKSTLELRNDQYKTFDKSILGVSGGALALTIANVDKLNAGNANFSLLMAMSWLAFGAAIASNITSYWTGTRDQDCELEKIRESIEERREYSVGNWWRKATYSLNFLALLLFCVGIFLLAINAYQALDGNSHVATTSQPTVP
jgi:hypothetical protein